MGRKGGRRLTPSDAETLKRFAAVESLLDVASSDQQVCFIFKQFLCSLKKNNSHSIFRFCLKGKIE